MLSDGALLVMSSGFSRYVPLIWHFLHLSTCHQPLVHRDRPGTLSHFFTFYTTGLHCAFLYWTRVFGITSQRNRLGAVEIIAAFLVSLVVGMGLEPRRWLQPLHLHCAFLYWTRAFGITSRRNGLGTVEIIAAFTLTLWSAWHSQIEARAATGELAFSWALWTAAYFFLFVAIHSTCVFTRRFN